MISDIISSYLAVKVYTASVWMGGGRGVLSRVGDVILQEVYTLYVTRFRTNTKLLTQYPYPPSPQDINLEGEGPQTENQLPQSPFAGNF